MKKHLLKIPSLLTLLCLFLIGLIFFTLPSQSRLVAQTDQQPQLTREVSFDLPEPALYPVRKTNLEAPVLTATGAAVLDRESGVFLFTKNPDQRLLPASTVKVMTGFLSLEHYLPLEALVVLEVSDEGQDMDLIKGELITVEALLYGLLVSSANDAAEVLAQNYPGGREKFVLAMNEKAQDLSLENTFFTNPTGLDNNDEVTLGGEKPYSSARDLAWLTDLALENETFRKIVATKRVTLQDPQKKYFHPPKFRLIRLCLEPMKQVCLSSSWILEDKKSWQQAVQLTK